METLNIKDRVKVTTTSTGNGVLTLTDTAADGYVGFATAYGGDTINIPACIVHQSADEWEACIISFDLSSLEITRTRTIAGTNGTTAVSFSSGTKDVFVGIASEFYKHLQNVIPVTVASCTNTTTPTDILTATIPANAWAGGEKIVIDVIITGTENIAVLTLDLAYGSDTYADLTASNAPQGHPARLSIEMWRVGTDIYINKLNDVSAVNFAPSPFSSIGADSYSGNAGTILTPVTFNTEKDLVITATYDVADAGDSVEILVAKVTKF
jgi:hypothetical protein